MVIRDGNQSLIKQRVMKTLRGKRSGAGSKSPEKVQECTVRNELGSG